MKRPAFDHIAGRPYSLVAKRFYLFFGKILLQGASQGIKLKIYGILLVWQNLFFPLFYSIINRAGANPADRLQPALNIQ